VMRTVCFIDVSYDVCLLRGSEPRVLARHLQSPLRVAGAGVKPISMDFLHFPTLAMARVAPFCRVVDAHLYA
jgi:hypothetical protein